MEEPLLPAEKRDEDGGQRLLAEALGEVSAALSSTLELEDLLDLILDRAARVVPCIFGTMLLIEGDHAEPPGTGIGADAAADAERRREPGVTA